MPSDANTDCPAASFPSTLLVISTYETIQPGLSAHSKPLHAPDYDASDCQ